jgi:DNA-binding NarL/FixJ family response regulator
MNVREDADSVDDREALRLIGAGAAGLAVIDADALQMLQAIHAQSPRVRVVVVSGDDTEDATHRLRASGAAALGPSMPAARANAVSWRRLLRILRHTCRYLPVPFLSSEDPPH